MMPRVLALLLLLLTGSLATASTNDRVDRFAAIERFAAVEMAKAGAPGLAYAVVEDGAIYVGTAGETRAGSGNAVTAATPFLLGSITKSFTALSVMQLAEAGKVDLNAPIARYLPEFRGKPGAAITLRQLMSHLSGWSTGQGNQHHVEPRYGEDALARTVAAIADWRPAYPPGIRWAYSNANYMILGRLIEVVGGTDYATYVETRILKPLGMADSFVVYGDRAAMAVGHRPWFGGKRAYDATGNHYAIAPAGGVIASARDVARYLAVMMNGSDDILSAKGKAAMMRPAGDASPSYGLGWMVDTANGTIFHTGSSPGVETLAAMRPGERRAVVVLVNAGSGIGFGETGPLRTGIAARALGGDDVGEGSRWHQKATYLGIVALPILFLLAIGWAWTHRAGLRAKRRAGAFGLFSLWFPLITTAVMAWALLWLVPTLFGASLATLRLYQPDFALAMIAGSILGIGWAVLRLGLAYSGRRAAAA